MVCGAVLLCDATTTTTTTTMTTTATTITTITATAADAATAKGKESSDYLPRWHEGQTIFAVVGTSRAFPSCGL